MSSARSTPPASRLRPSGQLATDRERVLRRLAVRERVLHLERGDGMDRMSPPKRRGSGLAEPEAPGLSVLAEPGHGAHRLLDRNLGIHPVLIVEVDRVDAESLQTRV